MERLAEAGSRELLPKCRKSPQPVKTVETMRPLFAPESAQLTFPCTSTINHPFFQRRKTSNPRGVEGQIWIRPECDKSLGRQIT